MAYATGASAPQSTGSLARIVSSSVVGTSLEWYDHFIYGSAAALVFPKLFFSQEHPLTALLLSLTTYGVAFVARPVGAAIFGHFGDRIGRKSILIITLLAMGFATFAIGLLPTYPSVGLLAPVLLVLLRLIQGLALGGEWGGAALMVNEFDPNGRRRGFYGSLVQVASPIGLLLANAAFALVTWLVSEDAFFAWGWRVPFLLSAILVAVGYYIRRRVSETPLFEQVEARQLKSRAPLLEVMRQYWRQVLIAVGSRIGSDIVFYVFTLFLLVYVPQKLGLPRSIALTAVLAAAVAQIIGIPLFGALSDRYGRRPVLIFGAMSAAVWGFVFFMLADTKIGWLIVLSSFIGMFLHAAMWGPLASFLPEMFETRVRCTGASLGFQLAGVFGGAPAPIIATQLVASFGSTLPVSIYLALTLVLVIVSVSLTRETANVDLREIDRDAHRAAAGATAAPSAIGGMDRSF